MREPKTINATYREVTETARRLIRPCFTCVHKHTEQCHHCPPLRVRNAVFECVRAGYRVLQKKGYVAKPEEEIDETDLIFVDWKRKLPSDL